MAAGHGPGAGLPPPKNRALRPAAASLPERGAVGQSRAHADSGTLDGAAGKLSVARRGSSCSSWASSGSGPTPRGGCS